MPGHALSPVLGGQCLGELAGGGVTHWAHVEAGFVGFSGVLLAFSGVFIVCLRPLSVDVAERDAVGANNVYGGVRGFFWPLTWPSKVVGAAWVLVG